MAGTRASIQADFLAARLDELQEDAGDLHNRHDDDLHTLEVFGDCSCGVPDRMRRLVAAMRNIADAARDIPDGNADMRQFGTWEGIQDAAVILAAAWDDHPDYPGGG